MSTPFSYLQPVFAFDAVVAEALPNPTDSKQMLIRVDPCYFYPLGGGQEGDRGTIGDASVVTTVKDPTSKSELAPAYLVVAAPSELRPGAQVHCTIDKEYRAENAKLHTGQHIFTGIAFKMFGVHTTSVHLDSGSATLSSFEFREKLTTDQIRTLEVATNRAIARNYVVQSTILRDQAELNAYGSIDDPANPRMHEHEFPIRIVEVEDCDMCPCCGTHVVRTGEIGVFKVFSVESSRGGVRLFVAAGLQCLGLLNERLDVLAAVCAEMTTKETALLRNIQALRVDLKASRKRERDLGALALPVLEDAHYQTAATIGGVPSTIVNLLAVCPLALSEALLVARRVQKQHPGLVLLFHAVEGETVAVVAGGVGQELAPIVADIVRREFPGATGGGKGTYVLKFGKILGTKAQAGLVAALQ